MVNLRLRRKSINLEDIMSNDEKNISTSIVIPTTQAFYGVDSSATQRRVYRDSSSGERNFETADSSESSSGEDERSGGDEDSW